MRKFVGKIVNHISALALLVGAATSAVSADAITDFDSKFRAAVKKHKVPGAAYAIIKDGKIVKTKGYGRRSLGTQNPVDSNTVFRLASVSKTFAADLTALLVAEGKLSWDDKVSMYVPNFKLKTPGHAEKLTIDHLLSHSTGLTPNAYDNMLEDGWSLQKIIPRFKRLKPICKPGNCYGYQNIVFSFIEPVIEKRTGKPYEALVEERILKPLNMETASLGLQGFLKTSNRAEPHVLTRKGWYRSRVKENYYNVAPAAGVNASITDLAKWVRAHMGSNTDVLSEEVLNMVTAKRIRTKREMNKRVWRPVLEDAHYGYGWRIYQIGGEEIVLHAGGVAGFRSLVGFSKKHGVGHVMLMNAETRSIDQLGAEFWAEFAKDVHRMAQVAANTATAR
nr:serine hydrolase domain-containing protein [Kordiimonas laminariae]